jgi:hypothetical protein
LVDVLEGISVTIPTYFLKDNMHNKNIIRAVEQQQQEEEDEKIRKFIKAKKRLIQMRMDKDAETHR